MQLQIKKTNNLKIKIKEAAIVHLKPTNLIVALNELHNKLMQHNKYKINTQANKTNSYKTNIIC